VPHDGYRALIAFLHAPLTRVDRALGDAVTETLSKILAGISTAIRSRFSRSSPT
jgi:hypothetical protein